MRPIVVTHQGSRPDGSIRASVFATALLPPLEAHPEQSCKCLSRTLSTELAASRTKGLRAETVKDEFDPPVKGRVFTITAA